jgi:hypothetical protein
MKQSQQFLENAESALSWPSTRQIAKPPGQLSCDSLARSSMILGNPTETTMGSDEKRSGDDRRASKERRSGTDTRSGEATNWRTPIWSRSEIAAG